MSRFAEGSIAGIALVDTGGLPIRIDVLDGEALKGTAAATSVSALDNTVHTQMMLSGEKSVHFGAKFYQMPLSLLNALVLAMEDAMLLGNAFAVTLGDDDGVDDIAVMAVLDYQAQGGKAYTRGTFSSGYVRDITIRFVSTGPQI